MSYVEEIPAKWSYVKESHTGGSPIKSNKKNRLIDIEQSYRKFLIIQQIHWLDPNTYPDLVTECI